MEDYVYVPVFQGETRVSNSDQEVMTTILGSCVAACLWDPVAKVGGLNHFLLPGDMNDRGNNLNFGVNAMELLVNGLLKKGAERSRLNAKLFGGAKMFDNSGGIGMKNIQFAEWFMSAENFTIVGRCLGGGLGRKIRFWPTSGRVQRSFIASAQVAAIEPAKKIGRSETAGVVELF